MNDRDDRTHFFFPRLEEDGATQYLFAKALSEGKLTADPIQSSETRVHVQKLGILHLRADSRTPRERSRTVSLFRAHREPVEATDVLQDFDRESAAIDAFEALHRRPGKASTSRAVN